MLTMLRWLQQINLMAVVLVVGLVVAGVSLYLAHRNPENNINIFDLFLHNGRLDKLAVVFLAAFGMTTWLMVDLQLSGKMTEGYLGLYGTMWIGPLFAKLILNKPDAPVLAEKVPVKP